ncbi:hypothetical protein FIBSPDRAFT_669593, partial [Athelia psychrophila]
YTTWHRSNRTVVAYKLHAKVLEEATGDAILSLHMACKLASRIAELTPAKVDICPFSCITPTGEFTDMTSCPHIHDTKICGAPHY